MLMPKSVIAISWIFFEGCIILISLCFFFQNQRLVSYLLFKCNCTRHYFIFFWHSAFLLYSIWSFSIVYIHTCITQSKELDNLKNVEIIVDYFWFHVWKSVWVFVKMCIFVCFGSHVLSRNAIWKFIQLLFHSRNSDMLKHQPIDISDIFNLN